MGDPTSLLHAAAEAARDYCRLIGQAEDLAPKPWLEQVEQTLARLESALRELPYGGSTIPYTLVYDLDARFELYLRLKHILAGEDEFWSEADHLARDGVMSGSLAENLTDVFFELQRGLACYSAGLEGQKTATRLWLDGYHSYWHQKLREACKRLAETRPSFNGPD